MNVHAAGDGGDVAFFLEATFIGLWIFGWDRLPSDGLSVLLLFHQPSSACCSPSSSWRSCSENSRRKDGQTNRAVATKITTMVTRTECGAMRW